MSHFAQAVIAWQREHGRHGLPWQQTCDPYRIWLSEIMLQQTQVSTVLRYYERFLAAFPDVLSLAKAHVESVLELWAGLGYYARARNLHRCARQVAEVFGGHFPTEARVLETLPGIGRSTAAAIASFAVGERAAILDGNVKRVLSRFYALDLPPGTPKADQELWALAESLLPQADMAAYTQGLMDLGATLCTRSNPRCSDCPLYEDCMARQSARQDELPRPKPGKALKEKEAVFTLMVRRGEILLQRRPPAGIWGGLLVPPEEAPETLALRWGVQLDQVLALPPIRHTFTHFRLRICPVVCAAPGLACQDAGWQWLAPERCAQAALPTPFRKLLTELPALCTHLFPA